MLPLSQSLFFNTTIIQFTTFISLTILLSDNNGALQNKEEFLKMAVNQLAAAVAMKVAGDA